MNAQKPNATFSEATKLSNTNTADDNMPQKNNMSSLSSTSANKSSMNHESPKDHSINIENAAPYYQGSEYNTICIEFIQLEFDLVFPLKLIEINFQEPKLKNHLKTQKCMNFEPMNDCRVQFSLACSIFNSHFN